jgi:hypothetical protein
MSGYSNFDVEPAYMSKKEHRKMGCLETLFVNMREFKHFTFYIPTDNPGGFTYTDVKEYCDILKSVGFKFSLGKRTATNLHSPEHPCPCDLYKCVYHPWATKGYDTPAWTVDFDVKDNSLSGTVILINLLRCLWGNWQAPQARALLLFAKQESSMPMHHRVILASYAVANPSDDKSIAPCAYGQYLQERIVLPMRDSWDERVFHSDAEFTGRSRTALIRNGYIKRIPLSKAFENGTLADISKVYDKKASPMPQPKYCGLCNFYGCRKHGAGKTYEKDYKEWLEEVCSV